MEPLARQETYGRTPEARVLIIMTGGTICMQNSADGLVPVRGFLEACMAPRPEFNDGKEHEAIDVSVEEDVTKKMRSLRTPKSTYGKRVRCVLCSEHRVFPFCQAWLEITLVLSHLRIAFGFASSSSKKL